MTKHKISILTICYQAADTIIGTLETIAAQNIEGVECLVQDGNSTDNTAELVTTFPHARFVSQPDAGIYDALNKGVDALNGDIIGLLHAGDFYPNKGVLAAVQKQFDDNADLVGVYGDLQYVHQKDAARVVRHWKSSVFSRTKLACGWMPPHPTLFLRKEVYQEIGGFDTRYRISADYDFILRVFDKYGTRIAYMPQVLVHMRSGGISNSGLKNLFTKSKEDFVIATRFKLFAPLTVFGKIFSKALQIRVFR